MPTEVEIIARLGHACGLPWARCPGAVPTSFAKCVEERGHPPPHYDSSGNDWVDGPEWVVGVPPLPPTLAEWQAEWEREHPGEPGPVSSWRSDDGRVEWSVDRYLSVEVRVRVAEYIGYRYVRNGIECMEMRGDGPMADAAECVRLMQAAEGAGR